MPLFHARSLSRAGSFGEPGYIRLLIDRAFKSIRLHDDDIAGKPVEGSFGCAADDDPFQARARHGTHDDNPSVEFLCNLRQLVNRVALAEVNMVRGKTTWLGQPRQRFGMVSFDPLDIVLIVARERCGCRDRRVSTDDGFRRYVEYMHEVRAIMENR